MFFVLPFSPGPDRPRRRTGPRLCTTCNEAASRRSGWNYRLASAGCIKQRINHSRRGPGRPGRITGTVPSTSEPRSRTTGRSTSWASGIGYTSDHRRMTKSTPSMRGPAPNAGRSLRRAPSGWPLPLQKVKCISARTMDVLIVSRPMMDRCFGNTGRPIRSESSPVTNE